MPDPADLSRLQFRHEEPAKPRRSRRSRAWLVVALAVLAVAAALSIAFFMASRRGPEVRVATAAVRGGQSGSGGGLTANGYVVARTKASVSSKVPGRLEFLGVEEGDRVAIGAVIARLEAAEYEAAVRTAAAETLAAEAAQHEAEAGMTQAERALERAIALDSLVSEQSLEDARTAVQVARAKLGAASASLEAARQRHAGARANLDNTIIRAPFAGTILRKDAEVGEVVAPAVAGGGLTRGAVVTMADLSTLEVEVDVNEAYIAQVRDDQPAEVVLDAYPADQFPAHVRQIMPTADRQKATVLVRVAIDSEDARILPEMGARVVFLEKEGEPASGAELPARVYVPAAAVRSEGGQDVVWVVIDGRASRRTIEAGPVMAGEREVRSGLDGGETLILDPAAELRDGARVRIAEDNDAQENG
ncbi:MAG: efflux RND transporter periplasmic adaptor subunit [Longimicrobiales bacterium]